MRRAAALGTSRVILWLASPITPNVADFDNLHPTRVLAEAIRDSRGEVIYEHERKTHRAFNATEAAVLNGALQRVVGEGTGRAAGIGRPLAGKTGTTEENVDAWFAGYVPQVATAVWVGYDPAQPMTNVHRRTVTGGSFPAAAHDDDHHGAADDNDDDDTTGIDDHHETVRFQHDDDYDFLSAFASHWASRTAFPS